MLLALLVLAVVALALTLPTILRAVARGRERLAAAHAGRRRERLDIGDPGRERRAEQRARELLRSCVNDEEWAMYRDLGFIRVKGRLATDRAVAGERDGGEPAERGPTAGAGGEPPYAYLIYPHKPVVAYVPKTRRLLSEYCVEFPDLTGAIRHSRLPDSDDVLAKWMALTGDERRLINKANMHLPGRQIDPGRIRRDLWRLAEWERQRRGGAAPAGRK
jgi:hypothetical protein